MEPIHLIARFNVDWSVTFDHFVNPKDKPVYNSGFIPTGIHVHGKSGVIVVSILADNLDGERMTPEQLNRFRNALDIEIAKYGHKPLPPNSFAILSIGWSGFTT